MLLIALLGLAGCWHIGPGTIVDDRLAYNEAIVTSWKEQTLLNIVRFRYFDVPEFVDVSSVVGGYENAQSGSATIGTMLFPNDPVKHILSPGLTAARTLSDRPTITYTPQTSPEFTRNLLNPLSALAIFNFIESGIPAENIMALAVESINGVRNRQVFRSRVQPADPEFPQVMQTLTTALGSGHVSLRLKPAADKTSTDLFMTFQDQSAPRALAEELAHLRSVLRLDPQVREFKIVHGVLPQANNEIAIRTRSMLRIMTFLSIGVQVPPEHLSEGLAHDMGEFVWEDPNPQLTVYSGLKKPAACYAAVHYQGYWFWIDPRDFNSRRSIAYLKRFLALADTGPKSAPPALTIRAN